MIRNKLMKNRLHIRWTLPFWLVFCLCLFFAVSCQKPPIKINLIADQTSYRPQEPIKIQIRIYNDNFNFFGQKKPVITRKGFFTQDFHLRLNILDPNGGAVAHTHSGSATEPTLPYRSGNRFLVPVEIIKPDDENIYVMDDARKYYSMGETYGWYTAIVRTSLETFSRYREYPTGEPYGELFAFCNKTFDPLSSNKIRFEIAPVEPPIISAIKAHVYLLKIAAASQPDATKTTLENAEVRLYRVSKIPPDFKSVSGKTYGRIWNSVKPQQSRLTYSSGTAVFSGVARDDYLVLSRHPVFAELSLTGTLVEKDDSGWRTGGTIDCSLSVTRQPDGTMVPGRTVQSRTPKKDKKSIGFAQQISTKEVIIHGSGGNN
ncbi:MAG: hypothetical protein HKO68_02840 [Desulfobacterales bacterium]|nr:hypothetical protein [Deltaproteobacteria bacterium]NNL75256.1 hypothetical protein [Desulfobacterales bacterium]